MRNYEDKINVKFLSKNQWEIIEVINEFSCLKENSEYGWCS